MTRRARGLLLAPMLVQALLLVTVVARPPVPPPALPIVTGDSLLNHAERAALRVLAADQEGRVHRAAPFYTRPWLRDSYAWGMVPDDAGTLSTYARGELRYWLRHQQPFGGWLSFPYSGWYDETAIMIAAVLDAYRLTGDRGMVRRALPALRRGWAWLHGATDPRHDSRCLLWVTLRPTGPPWAADWADQVARPGYTPQLEGLWYRATQAMAALEWLAGSRAAAHGYERSAECIAHDVNRLLWSVDAPAHRDARPLPAFGHYRAWPPGRHYFEIDGNALLLASGVAGPRRRADVLNVVAAHSSYLLGGDGAGPARVLYGDYAPADYGPIHNWMRPGQYQSAYWPSVGGLLAVAAASNDCTTLALTVLRGLARRNGDAGSAFYEWYRGDGRPGSAGHGQYGWGARMYLLALYRAYLGVDDAPSITAPADLVLRAAPGPARGELVRLGMHITIVGHGAGHVRYARLGRRILRSALIPARLLYNGAVLDVYRSG
jgi:hypothetical protein